MESISGLVVHQWLPSWNNIDFNPARHQRRPPESFVVMSVPASVLRALSGVQTREAKAGRTPRDETKIQRKLDPDRTNEISKYIEDGYPLSSISDRRRDEFSENLQKPGWLPGAIVVNVVANGESREGDSLLPADALDFPVTDHLPSGSVVRVGLPSSWEDVGWEPEGSVHPIEVIDGQHRLWAFDEQGGSLEYDLPVVAFFGLDFSWQAYLFWTINIKPKKISTSLAFDLYPLLRDQEWLEAGEGLNVYRETRAQELTEALWSFPSSPWRERINMLGETGQRATMPVTQASFVRALSESFIRPANGRFGLGGLFGGTGNPDIFLTRQQQAALLIECWALVRKAVRGKRADSIDDPFEGPYTLLAQDQGVRAFCQFTNDCLYLAVRDQSVAPWRASNEVSKVENATITEEIESLKASDLYGVMKGLIAPLGEFDWRTTKHPLLTPAQQRDKLAYRGTGGYKVLRDELLRFVGDRGSGRVAKYALDVLDRRKLG